MYVSFIRDAKREEGQTLKILLTELHQKYCILSSKKHQEDDRSRTISERVESFSFRNKSFCGKHIRFDSSSSDEEDSIAYDAKTVSSSNHASTCPYPSVAEEMKRLGCSNKKRKAGTLSPNRNELSKSSGRCPSKVRKGHVKQDVSKSANDCDNEEVHSADEADFTLSDGALKLFISTWKDTCKELSVAAAVEKMLRFYNFGDETKAQRKRAKVMSSFPFVELLNVMVISMKHGMWDSIYDNLKNISLDDMANPDSGTEICDTKPNEKHESNNSLHVASGKPSVRVEEIIRRISLYFDRELSGEKYLNIFNRLHNCGLFLAEQFQVHDFESLGWGGFFNFLEKHLSMLPIQLQKFLSREMCEGFPLEVLMHENVLTALLSQASEFSSSNVISKQMVSALLARQFPSNDLKVVEKDLIENFTDIIGSYKNNILPKRVLFSATLLGAENLLGCGGKDAEESSSVETDIESRASPLSSVASKDALDVLLRAPLLSDLNSWCHWDLRFAPSLGPLLGWLCKVNLKELLCLVTRDGNVIRVDPSATVDSFLEAALQGSAHGTAAQLLSLISLNGEKHLPFSLLKCYAKRAFEVIFNNHFEEVELYYDRKSFVPVQGPVKLSGASKVEVEEQKTKLEKSGYAASKFLLDCLGHLPAEFRGLASDVLLSGLRSVIKDAPVKVLSACEQTEQRIMLHDAGLLLGIVEWINDYHCFCSSDTSNSGRMENASSIPDSCTNVGQKDFMELSQTEQRHMIVPEESLEPCSVTGGLEAVDDSVSMTVIQMTPEFYDPPASVIDSIRRDEFGLDSNSPGAENSMLQKQHARLGRALQCLSQELYSQDSHFILELVQNADDNRYPELVEPTLAFFLHRTGIVVLNNECGFTPENIRALCDVGRSTKKGSTGYIGKKGIGFKSVFRVSDAPEIHSNGFHFKFDISEGQIGYILPTVVPPYDVDSLNRMLSGHALQLKDARWNTCVALPFRSVITESSLVNNVEPMFSDLHPSLLLFLHRLQCIVYRNMIDDSFLVMRKEVVSENIIKVSCGENSLTWFVESEKLNAANLRADVQKTEIAIAFRLDELEDGTYRSCVIQEPIFAYLPLRTYGLKFILQGDFILTSSREDVDEDSPWNQWLLSELPGLFVGALRSFCSLPSFRENLGKAVSTYMELVPLAGEVHGFFSCLTRTIISRLRTTNCLLLEGDNDHWVPPCKVLRGWNENARVLLKDCLLQEHLGLGFLDKDIVVSDSLSRALGIEDYGPKLLVQILSSVSHKKGGLRSMGLPWLSSFLTELHSLLFHPSGLGNLESGVDRNLMDSLRKIPFIPLSDGIFTSLDEGAIWLPHDATGFDGGDGFEAFPMLYSNLRTVDHSLLLASSGDNSAVDNLVKMLFAVGVQRMSAHEIIKVYILPAFEDRSTDTADALMVDYLCFVMTHLQSGCHDCHNERNYIISELRNKALIRTNYGFRRPSEALIHFGEEFGNQVNIKRLTKGLDMLWHEVDSGYLKHPALRSDDSGLKKWREFFQEIGITDFVQVVSVEKSIAELFPALNGGKQDTISSTPELAVRDWESPELVDLLSLLHKSNNHEGCKYLLEVLDTLWDDCYHDKTTVNSNLVASGLIGSSKSSFMRIICDTQWVVSSMNSGLHRPKDLFHDCDEVRSMLGMTAPYAVPKVTSTKLLNDIGFKTKVCLDDALEILGAWVQFGNPFKARISQMTRFYKFMWNEMAESKQKIAEKFCDVPSIFVPHENGSRQSDLISGTFLPLKDVFWKDSAAIFDEIKQIDPQISTVVDTFDRKTLCNIYPALHDFFVNGCGVPETPSFHEHLKILEQLAQNVSPSSAAKTVFKIFRKWSDDLKSEKISEDICQFREKLQQLDFTVLPTEKDKWVSLHSSFSLVCWCDDEKLKKRFKNKDKIQFLYFGELSDEEQQMIQTNVSTLLDSLGIPSISKVVKREAKYEGLRDSGRMDSLVNWALPYAQRYFYTLHHEKYVHDEKSVYHRIKHLKVFVVEKLCFKNVIPEYGISSKKDSTCNCLLQDNALYTTPDVDSHSLFMELSCLFFDGAPDLHVANFLHMIKTMAESGLSEDQMESFIVNSQKVQKIPEGERVWSLKSSCRAKKKSGKTSWLTATCKTGQGSEEFVHNQVEEERNNVTDVPEAIEEGFPIQIMDSSLATADNGYSDMTLRAVESRTSAIPLNPNPEFNERDQLQTGTPWGVQAQQTGRLGEAIAYRYFAESKAAMVKWVNEHNETGLPYDIVVEEQGGRKEYVEVKATISARKDWFNLSVREWQFAYEKGESYVIAHVLVGNENAILTQHRNPVKLCQEGKLRLLILMPKQ
ncbi:PREDICTED: uncharacterized protein LOC104804807 isoform X2 [Tarenaya hassleriana]|nr:PREDICTED: uncharacterized protein LOC104804807 isoform X2 [Tarenaya hassleriana]